METRGDEPLPIPFCVFSPPHPPHPHHLRLIPARPSSPNRAHSPTLFINLLDVDIRPSTLRPPSANRPTPLTGPSLTPCALHTDAPRHPRVAPPAYLLVNPYARRPASLLARPPQMAVHTFVKQTFFSLDRIRNSTDAHAHQCCDERARQGCPRKKKTCIIYKDLQDTA